VEKTKHKHLASENSNNNNNNNNNSTTIRSHHDPQHHLTPPSLQQHQQTAGATSAAAASSEPMTTNDPIRAFVKKGNPSQETPVFVQLINSLAAAADFQRPPPPQRVDEVLDPMEIRSRWVHRPRAFRERWGEEWQQLQSRYLFLLAYPSEEREAIFYQLISWYNWTYKTAQKQWGAFIAGVGVISATVTGAMRAQAKVFHFLANEEDTKRPTSPATIQNITSAAKRAPRDVATAMMLAFLLGQRMGDVLNLRSPCTREIYDPSTQMKFVSVLFRQGKTTRATQPFALHLPADMELSANLQELDQRRTGQALFVDGHEDDKKNMLDKISKILQQEDETLRCLSIRRGGLQHMSLMGLPLTVILHHSRHANTKNLERYLGWGELLLESARERWKLEAPQNQIGDLKQALTYVRDGTILAAIDPLQALALDTNDPGTGVELTESAAQANGQQE
jgi:hypothetical protein